MSYVDFNAPKAEVDALADYWRQVGQVPSSTPRALLVVSAHWEAEVPTLMTSPNPPMLYDYYGFPPAAYEIRWPAPGAPWLGARVQELLGQADIPSAVDGQRGFDHGTFVPLGRSFPKADIPTLQLSLKNGLDPKLHLALGRALMPLRDEGVFIIGSGLSYHNMRGFGSSQSDREAQEFDAWLQETIALPSEERDQRLAAWERAPSARRVHPREEHLLPLMVAAGAAGDDRGKVPFSGKVFGKVICAAQFG